MVGWHFVLLNSTCPRRLLRALKITLTKKEAKQHFPFTPFGKRRAGFNKRFGSHHQEWSVWWWRCAAAVQMNSKWPSLKACCTLTSYSSFVVQLQPSKSGKIFRWCTDKTCQSHVTLVMLLKLLVWWRTVGTTLCKLTNLCECRCNNRTFLYWPGLWTWSVSLFSGDLRATFICSNYR